MAATPSTHFLLNQTHWTVLMGQGSYFEGAQPGHGQIKNEKDQKERVRGLLS